MSLQRINTLFLLFVIVCLSSCKATKHAAAPQSAAGNSYSVSLGSVAAGYINTYKDLAVSEMKRTGIPASITLAQGMLESDYGRSTLARTANNHFGIKCHNDWTGQTIQQHDDRRNECFRKYRRPEDSFYDHSDFLKYGSRYKSLFSLDPANYKAWAHGLKSAGYATNPDYASLLIRKIEENKLYQYDSGYIAKVPEEGDKNVQKPGAESANKVTVNPAQTARSQNTSVTFGDLMAMAPRIMENNRVQYIIVKEGETKKSIERDFQLLDWELARYNELKEDFVPVKGQMLYLEPKRDKAETGIEFHIAAQGDTMYGISQKYGIRLKNLLEMNKMTEGAAPVKGQKIWLQEKMPGN